MQANILSNTCKRTKTACHKRKNGIAEAMPFTENDLILLCLGEVQCNADLGKVTDFALRSRCCVYQPIWQIYAILPL